jgi:fluoroquinolone transport system permease protein
MKQIRRDSMLYAILAAPLLAACFFRFGIPFAESLLCEYLDRSVILADYYLLFDLLLVTLTPVMFCFASAMVMLTELDENIIQYIAVTPVGKRGYIASRLVIPAVISMGVSTLLLLFFRLTDWALPTMLITCLLTALMSVGMCLMILSFAHNRVEGMAIGKLSGLIMMGLPIPFFVNSEMQYAASILPSFWIAKISVDTSLLFAFPALFVNALWIGWMHRRFRRKIL